LPSRACTGTLNEQTVGSDDPLSISQLLDKIVREHPHESLAMSDLAELLHYRSWGGLLLIFASINMLPLPPGASMFTGLPILVISAQMALGRPAPWFPARLDRRGLKMDELKKLIEKLRPLEIRIERIFRPRLLRLSGQRAGRIIGAICFLLSLIVVVPIPIVHIAPAAAVALFGLSLVYRDGVVVVAAALAGLLSLIVSGILIGSGWYVLMQIIDRFHV
jgi:hypothetical protein